jgi:senataxin
MSPNYAHFAGPQAIHRILFEGNLKTMKVERRRLPEPNARVLEEINQEVVRQEIMIVDDAADHADVWDDDDDGMDADDGGGDD